jgi:hypothetical protein
MRAAIVAVVISIALSGVPLMASPLSGALDGSNMSDASHPLVQAQVAKQKKKKREAKGPPYIPGWVMTPYGRRDCIGRWHWHEDGSWYHCHGQLIKPW